MKNLEILHPDKTASFSVSTVVSLAKRFPQLGLSDAESLRLLREESMDSLCLHLTFLLLRCTMLVIIQRKCVLVHFGGKLDR